MLAEEIREYCLTKKGVTEGFPFNETTLVFKVGDKMFLLMDLESQPLKFSAKADPEWSEDLREQYHQITGAYHMNKMHWNTISVEVTVATFNPVKIVNDLLRSAHQA